MSLDAMDWVWTNSQSKGVARLVMLAIADKVMTGDCKAFAGLTFLQERANAGRSTVIGALRDLDASGELEIVEGETGRYGAAVYRLPKALGHVRGESVPRGRTMQPRVSLEPETEPEIGAETAPIQEAEDAEPGAGTEPDEQYGATSIGAVSAPNQQVAETPNGAETALNPSGENAEIGAETAPDQKWHQSAIGADSGRESVQILDGIGADPAPHNQEPKKNQRTRSSAAASKPKSDPTPKQARTRTAAPDAFEVTDELAEWAWSTHKVPRSVAVSQTEVFLNHHRSRGNTMASWTAAWKNWIAKVPEWSPHLLRTASAVAVNTPASYQNPTTNAGYTGGWRRPSA